MYISGQYDSPFSAGKEMAVLDLLVDPHTTHVKVFHLLTLVRETVRPQWGESCANISPQRAKGKKNGT